jgi:hypothetical protein
LSSKDSRAVRRGAGGKGAMLPRPLPTLLFVRCGKRCIETYRSKKVRRYASTSSRNDHTGLGPLCAIVFEPSLAPCSGPALGRDARPGGRDSDRRLAGHRVDPGAPIYQRPSSPEQATWSARLGDRGSELVGGHVQTAVGLLAHRPVVYPPLAAGGDSLCPDL